MRSEGSTVFPLLQLWIHILLVILQNPFLFSLALVILQSSLLETSFSLFFFPCLFVEYSLCWLLWESVPSFLLWLLVFLLDQQLLSQHGRLPRRTPSSAMERRTAEAGHLELFLFRWFCSPYSLSSHQSLPLEGETNTGHSSVSGICAPRLHLCAKYTRVACSSCSHYYRFHDPNDILFWISLDSFTFTPCSIADCTWQFWALVFFVCRSTVHPFGAEWNCCGMELLVYVTCSTNSIDALVYYGIHVSLRIVYGLSGIYLLIYMAKWIRRSNERISSL